MGIPSLKILFKHSNDQEKIAALEIDLLKYL